MAKMYYDHDADLSLLEDKTVAIIGYGSQGHAHALNLRDSGVDVIVGLHPGSRSRAAAEAASFDVRSVKDAAQASQIVVLLAPDTAQKQIFDDHVAPYLEAGDVLLFAHGFNVRYGQIKAPPGVDVVLVAPKAPGHRVREVFVEGAGTPGLVAVEQDASGQALARALAYSKAIGCTRAGVIETTFAEETETDLFGEQAVLCGGVSALIRNAFETLTKAGYQPEVAYFECLHELKLIVDLMYEGGLGYMWYSVSDTAEYGGYEAGDQVVGAPSRAAMDKLLAEIQSGKFAERWIAENRSGRASFEKRRAQERAHPIEEVGRKLRKMMPFLQAKDLTQLTGEQGANEQPEKTASVN
jgi:ketol-acid reductoisomerase